MLGTKLLTIVVAMLAVHNVVVLSQDNNNTNTSETASTVSSTEAASSSSSETPATAEASSTEATSGETTTEAASASGETTTGTATASGETTTATATASGASESTTNANPNPEVNQICPGNPGMVDATRLRAQVAHNYRRGRLAVGLVRNKKRRTLPTASNMRHLDYNCSLESSAMKSAKRCSVLADPNLPSGVQENNYLFPKSEAGSDENALIIGVKHWWSQIRETGGIGQGVTYTQYNVGKPIAWFTRMAWATTQSVGCAVAPCDSYWSVVCHYTPGGNELNKHLYMKGSPCSNCPDGTFCNAAKLCQTSSSITQ